MSNGQGPGYPAGGAPAHGGGAPAHGSFQEPAGPAGPRDPYRPPRAPAAAPPGVAGRASVGEMLGAFPKAVGLATRTVLGAYVVLTVASFLVGPAPAAVLRYLSSQSMVGFDLGDAVLFERLAAGVSLLSIFAAVPIFGLARAMRRGMVEGASAVGGFGGALKAAFSRYPHVLGNLFLVGIGLAIAVVFCVLPVLPAFFFFLIAPYLVAIGQEDPWTGIVRSCKMAVRNVGAFATLAAILVGTFALAAGIGWAMIMVLTPVLGPAGAQLAWQGIGFVLGFPVVFLAWVLMVSSFVTLETAETGTPLRP